MECPPLKVVVTGASGMIGQHVVRSLAIRGSTVLAVYRTRVPESMEHVYPQICDLSQTPDLSLLLKGVDVVVHLAWDGGVGGGGSNDPSNERPRVASVPTLSPVNLDSTRHLVRAMEACGTRRLVFLSALGASRRAQASFLKEKYQAEHIIFNSQIPERLILRSSVVWGGRGELDPFLRSILRILKFPFYPLPAKNLALAPLHARDIGRTISNAVFFKDVDTASLLEVQGSEMIPLGEICKIVSDYYVRKPRFPMSGFLAHEFLNFLERDRSTMPKTDRLKDYLAMAHHSSHALSEGNPLRSVINGTFTSFREQLTEV